MTSRIHSARLNVTGALQARASHTFASLGVHNYRLYFVGQAISLCGTWMQSIGQSLLVLHLTGSGVALGLVTGLQFAPVLFFAPLGGVLADRFSKRKLLFITQSVAGALALILGTLVATGAVRLWMVYVLAASLGLVNSVDNPTRQTFVHEMVGGEQLGNAVTLNSIIVNASRIVGPAIAGIVVARLGLAACFFTNGVSFIAVLLCLAMMRASELARSAPVTAAKGQLRAGFAYAWKTPIVRDVLLMLALVGTFSYEFSVTLPLLAHVTFSGTPSQVASSVAVLMSSMGAGAVLGGLYTASRHKATMEALTVSAFGFGVAIALVALSPAIGWAAVAMGVVGFFSVSFSALTNTILQVSTGAHIRGRVMALWAMAFMGATVIGAPIIGWVGQNIGPRWSLAIGALAAVLAGVKGMTSARAHAAGLASAQASMAPIEQEARA